MNNIVVLIPAYNPNQKLINLVSELKNNFSKIIIINDGSNRKSKKIFQELTNYPECTILEYSENRGKGYALKYGINYINSKKMQLLELLTKSKNIMVVF